MLGKVLLEIQKNKINKICLTWWGQAHDPWFPSPILDEYERVQASAEGWTQI